MKKWYMSCPFCANEIKEGALKCQYCHEFLNKDTEENNNIMEQSTARYKNKWLWIILWVIILIIVVIISSTKWVKTQRLVNKVERISENARTYDDIKKDLNNIEKKNPQEEVMFQELWELIDDFYSKNQSIDEDLLYIDASDYKNIDKIQLSLNSRELYDKYFTEYANNIDIFFKKYKDLDNTWNWKYSLTQLYKEIKDLSNSVSIYKNKYFNFFNYVLSIQDDFYVENDWQVYFYDWWSKMDKYNQLSSELYDAMIKFLEDFSNYSDYLKEYNRYWWS